MVQSTNLDITSCFITSQGVSLQYIVQTSKGI